MTENHGTPLLSGRFWCHNYQKCSYIRPHRTMYCLSRVLAHFISCRSMPRIWSNSAPTELNFPAAQPTIANHNHTQVKHETKTCLQQSLSPQVPSQSPTIAISSADPTHRGVPRRCHVLSAAAVVLPGSAFPPPFWCWKTPAWSGHGPSQRAGRWEVASSREVHGFKLGSKYPTTGWMEMSPSPKLKQSSTKSNILFCPHFSTFFGGSMVTLAPSTPSRGLNDMNSDANWFTMISDICCCMCHQAPLGAPALHQVRPSNVQRSPWCRHQWRCGPCDSQLSVVWIGSWDIQRWTWCNNSFITQGVLDFCFNTLGPKLWDILGPCVSFVATTCAFSARQLKHAEYLSSINVPSAAVASEVIYTPFKKPVRQDVVYTLWMGSMGLKFESKWPNCGYQILQG